MTPLRAGPGRSRGQLRPRPGANDRAPTDDGDRLAGPLRPGAALVPGQSARPATGPEEQACSRGGVMQLYLDLIRPTAREDRPIGVGLQDGQIGVNGGLVEGAPEPGQHLIRTGSPGVMLIVPDAVGLSRRLCGSPPWAALPGGRRS